MSASATGQKNDTNKSRWSLVPWGAMELILAALEYGAKKYPEKDNWKRVPNGQERYPNAAMRHLVAHLKGEYLDPESGLPHLAHAAVNILFALALGLSEFKSVLEYRAIPGGWECQNCLGVFLAQADFFTHAQKGTCWK